MLRLKAMFRARGIKTPGRRVYHPKDREEWLAKLDDDGVPPPGPDPLRPTGCAPGTPAQGEGHHGGRGPEGSGVGGAGEHSLPGAGSRRPDPGHHPYALALPQKRGLWAYCGLAVVTTPASEYEMVIARRSDGTPAHDPRPQPQPQRRAQGGLQGCATAATVRPGPLQDHYHGMTARGMRPKNSPESRSPASSPPSRSASGRQENASTQPS